MTRIKLLIVAAMALCAIGAVTAAMAQAEEPVLLCFPESCLSGLEGHFKGGKGSLSSLSGKELVGTEVEGKVKECKELGTSKKDTTLCKASIVFKGVKKEKVSCRSETSGGVKNNPEEVAVLVDVHLASELTLPAEVLQPLVLFKVLGVAGEEEELIINCGSVKEKIKGVLPCLISPGLTAVAANTESFELSCKQNATSHDQETGMCELLCEWLTEHPFESNLGSGFEDAGMNASGKGAFNREVFFDD